MKFSVTATQYLPKSAWTPARMLAHLANCTVFNILILFHLPTVFSYCKNSYLLWVLLKRCHTHACAYSHAARQCTRTPTQTPTRCTPMHPLARTPTRLNVSRYLLFSAIERIYTSSEFLSRICQRHTCAFPLACLPVRSLARTHGRTRARTHAHKNARKHARPPARPPAR